MAAVCDFLESNGAGESTTVSTNLNFGSVDAPTLTPSDNPINRADNNSFEKWVRARFTGTFTKIDNLQWWKSSGTYKTDESIDWDGDSLAYATPTDDTSVVATDVLPVADPGTANISIGSELTGSLVATGNSDYWCMQLQCTTDTPVGATEQKQFTLQYDEQ